jgi:hypothetical protein
MFGLSLKVAEQRNIIYFLSDKHQYYVALQLFQFYYINFYKYYVALQLEKPLLESY